MHEGWATGKRAFVNRADQACKFLVVLRPAIDSSPVVPNGLSDPMTVFNPNPSTIHIADNLWWNSFPCLQG